MPRRSAPGQRRRSYLCPFWTECLSLFSFWLRPSASVGQLEFWPIPLDSIVAGSVPRLRIVLQKRQAGTEVVPAATESVLEFWPHLEAVLASDSQSYSCSRGSSYSSTLSSPFGQFRPATWFPTVWLVSSVTATVVRLLNTINCLLRCSEYSFRTYLPTDNPDGRIGGAKPHRFCKTPHK